ncbi:M91 family zinc metallopeptidase [Rhodopila globiformis]|uniref:Uncharacterized protein n=1 Tax=Rhodopila globiformis TaxID=1071 RepID=A0A2S6N271_RHOGL|nr:M91 family zinc metallopeptidase [Rhodopila globiformis]PPQ28717.1 hypothetical protein CCS01_23810 [Rhodopila globiformis]
MSNGISSFMDFPGVLLSGEMSFIDQARAAILKLNSKPRGKALLKEIVLWLSKLKSSITIEAASGFDGQNGSGWDGATKVVRWSPLPRTNESADPDQLNGIPPFIILGHELAHALHTLQGTDNYGAGIRDDVAIEEARTIGLGPWANDNLTENGLREEWNYKPRTTFQEVGADRLLKGTKYAV